MIEERLMAAGSMEIRLRERFPSALKSLIIPAGYIVVTPAPVDDLNPAALIERSIYTGFLRSTGVDGRLLTGAHANLLLGDEEGHGDISRAADEISASSTTRLACIEALLDHAGAGSNGLTVGTVFDPTETPLDMEVPIGQTARQWLAHCRNPAVPDHVGLPWFGQLEAGRYSTGGGGVSGSGVGMEWRVNPDLTFDLGLADQWRDQTVIIGEVDDTYGQTLGVNMALAVTPVDLTDWAAGAYAIGTNNSVGVAVYHQTEPSPYTSPYSTVEGNLLQWFGFADLGADTFNDQAAVDRAAEALLDQRSEYRVQIDATSRRFLRLDIEPGDTVGIYAPTLDLTDSTNPQLVGGREIFPLARRVLMHRWPLLPTMGVYHITPTDPLTAVDLTRWVEWETDKHTELEIAAQSRSFEDLYVARSAP